MRKKTVLIGSAVLVTNILTFSLGLYLGYGIRDSKSSSGSFSAVVSNVVDGDTIDVKWFRGENRIRIIGIEAPEVRRGAKLNAHAKELGVEPEVLLEFGHSVSKRLDERIGGKAVDLHFADGKIQRDAFGRYLAYVYFEGMDINEWMLEEGLVWPRPEPHPKTSVYESMNKYARNLRLGVYRLKMR